MLVQSVSVFSLAVFIWALLPELKWMMMMMMITERRLALGSRCVVDDVCDDVSASCIHGICECRLTHYNLDGRCGNHQLGYYCLYTVHATTVGVAR